MLNSFPRQHSTRVHFTSKPVPQTNRSFCDTCLNNLNIREDLLFVADDFDTLVEQLAQKTVVVTAVCVNETDDSLERLTPCSQPSPIDPEITGALAKSEALGKGAAYYHPTPGYDEFLAYCSWRFHEPIPVEDIQSITTIFKRLSDLGLPSSRYFLELRDLGEDSVFTVFAPDYEEWYAHIWDLELLRA